MTPRPAPPKWYPGGYGQESSAPPGKPLLCKGADFMLSGEAALGISARHPPAGGTAPCSVPRDSPGQVGTGRTHTPVACK
jgi:hypothetical protein